MSPEGGRNSQRRTAIRRQRGLGSNDTKAAMKVLERYCKKKYRQSVIFANIGSQLNLAEPHSLSQDAEGHFHSEPFTPRSALDRNFTFEPSTAFSCPEGKNAANALPQQFTFDFGEQNLKEEIKYHKDRETWGSYLWRVFKFFYDYLGIKHVLLLLLMIVYALAGGYLFYSLEAPAEIERERLRQSDVVLRSGNYSKRVLERLYLRCDFPKISSIFQSYDAELRVVYGLETAWNWDFWNAVFYSGTIFTTIGYGNIACKTYHGRIATCIYAFFGVPLMLVVLNSMGKGLFLSVQAFWEAMRRFVRRTVRRLRKTLTMRRVSTLESVASEELVGLTGPDEEANDSGEEPDLFTTFPMTLALLTVFSYISVCSWLFCYWEDWDYPTAFYFFFISLSTVGLGDEVPNHPKRACAFFLFFIIGLALVSMCISILQVKVENKYMAALQLIDQEHQSTVEQEEREGEEDEQRKEEWKREDPLRPDRLPALPDSDVRWRRRDDSRGSELSSVHDRQTRTSSQIFMSSPSDHSPVCPPPVLGVFMARSISSRRPTSILVRSDSMGSQGSKSRTASMAKSHDDLLLSPTSPKSVSRLREVESPTGSTHRPPSPLSSPRLASLAVITEDLDEEVHTTSQSQPRPPPSFSVPLEVPEVRVENADAEEDREKEKERREEHSSLSSLCVSSHRM